MVGPGIGGGGGGAPRLRTLSTATEVGRRSGMLISARRMRTVPPASMRPWTAPRKVRSASRSAVSRSLTSGRASRAVRTRFTGIGAAMPIVPLPEMVPGPARPVRLAMRIVSPSATIVAAISLIWAPWA